MLKLFGKFHSQSWLKYKITIKFSKIFQNPESKVPACLVPEDHWCLVGLFNRL